MSHSTEHHGEIETRSGRPKVRHYVELKESDVERGYKSCRKIAKAAFPNRLWPFFNLPGNERRGIDALMFVIEHGLKAFRLEKPGQEIAYEELNEAREDLNDAVCGKYLAPEWGAVHDTVKHFNIPKQFMFDFFEGLDHMLRFGQPATIDDVRSLASRLGGSPFAAAVKVMGVTGPGYEVHAIECGQALLMTEWLAAARTQALEGKSCLASADMASTGCDLAMLAGRTHSKPVDYLVRLYAHHIEKLFQKSAPLFHLLEFDCARSVKAMVAHAWKTVLKLQIEPVILFSPEGPTTDSDTFKSKIRFVLGLNDALPFAADNGHADH